jgi:hypothetical protein
MHCAFFRYLTIKKLLLSYALYISLLISNMCIYSTLLGPNGTCALVAISGRKTVLIFRAHSFKGPCNGFARIKIITCCMIYRGPGFLVPSYDLAPSSPLPVSKLSLFPVFLCIPGRQERGGGRGGAKSYDSKKARSSINLPILYT